MGVPVGFVLFVAGALCVGCGPGGDGGSGDPRSQRTPDVLGTGARLVDLLLPRYEAITGAGSWLDPANVDSLACPSIPLDQETFVSGVTITHIDDFDETQGGAIGNLYVQDTLTPAAPNSGMTVFQPGFSPPDLRVVVGDVMDLFGLITEFQGPSSSKFGYCRTLPEMSGAMELRFEASDIAPTLIPVEDLATYVGSRQWMGMLVTVENVVLAEPPFPSASGRYSIRIDAGSMPLDEDIPSITNEHMDLEAVLPATTMAGMVLSRVTGVVTYFYGTHIAPRSAADIEF